LVDGLSNSGNRLHLRALARQRRKTKSGVKLPVTEGGAKSDKFIWFAREQLVRKRIGQLEIGHLTR
jgi:hypothetical protein